MLARLLTEPRLTQHRNQKRIPIFVLQTANLKEKFALTDTHFYPDTLFNDKVPNKLAGEHIKYFPKESEQHRMITKFLNENNMEFSVITPKNLTSLKVVLKGLPINAPIDEIVEGLKEQGFLIEKINQLSNTNTKIRIHV
ncbi:hypothetical protein CEXT_394381 [Caerostris extrusa]|uniref:Uncharacterized protein n=1 Tax=Caerostris extrusa TaxID=172846 RepID=A0AAV4YB74_CAEEX|nr:hypothetical protein CEXT_394381 [Caerostris extrusa]